MSINYKIFKRHYGNECQWFATVDGKSYADSFLVKEGMDVESVINSSLDNMINQPNLPLNQPIEGSI